jgi:hypothetical protein
MRFGHAAQIDGKYYCGNSIDCLMGGEGYFRSDKIITMAWTEAEAQKFAADTMLDAELDLRLTRFNEGEWSVWIRESPPLLADQNSVDL